MHWSSRVLRGFKKNKWGGGERDGEGEYYVYRYLRGDEKLYPAPGFLT
jgi:hypothetical protein